MRVGFVRQRGEHHKIARTAWAERKAVTGRFDAGNSAEQLAQPADLDAQPRTVRFIHVLGAECAGEKRCP